MKSSVVERFALPLLLLATYLLSAAWALSTPIPSVSGPQAILWGNFHPDEISHIAVVRYLAQHHALPPYLLPYDTSVHPPLYHGLAAALYLLFAPLFGDDGAMRMIRLCSPLYGVGIVYLVYAATCRVATRQTALLAALLVALIPTRIDLGGAVTNENLAALGAAGVFAVLVGGLYDHQGFKPRQIALLTVYLCIGIGSKVTCLGLLPVVVLALLRQGYRRGQSLGEISGRLAAPVLGPLLCWGWWFVRNQILYGDPMRQVAANQLWDGMQPGFTFYHAVRHMSVLQYALSLGVQGWLSYWGKFDGFSRFLPRPAYLLPLAVELIALVGWWRLLRAAMPNLPTGQTGEIPLLAPREDNAQPGPLCPPPLRALLLLFALFAVFVVYVYFAYNWRHYTPQGRYFFVLLLPWGMLLAIGWQSALTRAVRRWATPLLLVLMVIVNLYVLYAVPRRLLMPLSLRRITTRAHYNASV